MGGIPRDPVLHFATSLAGVGKSWAELGLASP